jgi:hypothetical protein
MEPPIGYGSTHRSIFPESQFRTDGGSVFQGAVVEQYRHLCSSRGSRRWRPFRATPSQGPYDQRLSSRGLDPGHHGHRYRWD